MGESMAIPTAINIMEERNPIDAVIDRPPVAG